MLVTKLVYYRSYDSASRQLGPRQPLHVPTIAPSHRAPWRYLHDTKTAQTEAETKEGDDGTLTLRPEDKSSDTTTTKKNKAPVLHRQLPLGCSKVRSKTTWIGSSVSVYPAFLSVTNFLQHLSTRALCPQVLWRHPDYWL